jgi:glyoxylase-like metal-dependent hydrolase (beta-lactamase superfamily II)
MLPTMSEEKSIGPLRFIPGGNKGKYPYSNSVYVEGAGVLIDAGADPDNLKALRDGPGVREIWLSHWHEDHIAQLGLFEGVPFRQMESEMEPLASLEGFLDWYGIADEEFRQFWRDNMVQNFAYRPRRAAAFFQPGEVIDLQSCSVEVMPAPGHTPGHTAFYFREPQVLFMGDYDLTAFGPWYGDRDSSIEGTIASVQRLRAVPARVWLTSHGEGLFEQDPGPLFDSYLGVIDEREAKLVDYLSAPRTLREIVMQWIVYRKPREPKAFFEWGEEALIGKHLQRLIRNGAVVFEDGRYRLT